MPSDWRATLLEIKEQLQRIIDDPRALARNKVTARRELAEVQADLDKLPYLQALAEDWSDERCITELGFIPAPGSHPSNPKIKED